MNSHNDSPAIGHTDWERADPTDMEIIEGPEKTAIYVQGHFLTELDTHTWQNFRDEFDTVWKGRAALLEHVRDFIQNPEDYTDALQKNDAT